MELVAQWFGKLMPNLCSFYHDQESIHKEHGNLFNRFLLDRRGRSTLGEFPGGHYGRRSVWNRFWNCFWQWSLTCHAGTDAVPPDAVN